MKEFNFNTTPIVDVVNEIFIDSVAKKASDIHFDPAEEYLKIRIRVDGDLRDYSIIDNKYKRNLITRIKLLAGMNITESRLPQDGAIKSVIEGKDLDMRVSCLPASFGEKVVIRILDYTMSFQGIESLGFTKQNYRYIERMIASPNGIILVTGATGSGKSTTVYSMLQRLNKEDTNIITVEDPVEMNIEGINQVQVNSEIGLDFSSVLRSILRQDPNVILIGEIRDGETAKIAIRASITGHLVLSTLHTNNSLTTIERLLDMDVERYLLSTSLKGIISQTLAKRLCKKCRKKRPTNAAEKKIFEKSLNMTVDEIYTPVGCDECRNGYRGRIAIQEVLYINDVIRDAINNNIPRDELRDLIYTNNVNTMFQDGLLKVVDGTTSIEEIFKVVDTDDDPIDVLGSEISKDEILENTNNANNVDNSEKTQTTDNINKIPTTSDNISDIIYSTDNNVDNNTENVDQGDIIDSIIEDIMDKNYINDELLEDMEDTNINNIADTMLDNFEEPNNDEYIDNMIDNILGKNKDDLVNIMIDDIINKSNEDKDIVDTIIDNTLISNNLVESINNMNNIDKTEESEDVSNENNKMINSVDNINNISDMMLNEVDNINNISDMMLNEVDNIIEKDDITPTNNNDTNINDIVDDNINNDDTDKKSKFNITYKTNINNNNFNNYDELENTQDVFESIFKDNNLYKDNVVDNKKPEEPIIELPDLDNMEKSVVTFELIDNINDILNNKIGEQNPLVVPITPIKNDEEENEVKNIDGIDNNSSNYTEKLINLINKDLFE